MGEKVNKTKLHRPTKHKNELEIEIFCENISAKYRNFKNLSLFIKQFKFTLFIIKKKIMFKYRRRVINKVKKSCKKIAS